MLKLIDLDEWSKLNSPFGNSEVVTALIKQLENTYSEEILDEICWEYIYHQGSLYQVTFATLPYLINICEKSTDLNFKLKSLSNIGVIIAELDLEDSLLTQTFEKSTLDKSIVIDIIESFKQSFQKLERISLSLFEFILKQEETEKRYFLITLAVINKKFKVAKVFLTFIYNDEYICVCPKCNNDLYLSNENDSLVMYIDDPVFNTNQETFLIQPKSPIQIIDEKNKLSSDFEFLTFYINKLKINSLKNIVKYLFSETKCPICQKEFQIFEAIH